MVFQKFWVRPILPFPVMTRGFPCHCAWHEPSEECELDVFKSTESFSQTFFLGFNCSSGCYQLKTSHCALSITHT